MAYDDAVQDPTDSENRVMEHYKSYTRRSPYAKEDAPYKVINYGAPGPYIRSTKPLPDFFPSSVIVLITMHGRTKEPMQTPLNVERFIGTDFGTCYFYNFERDEEERLMGAGFKKKKKVWGEAIKTSLVTSIAEARQRWETRTPKFEKREDFELFKLSKHHTRPKKFKRNMPMFNKLYEFDPEDPYYVKHSIYVRGDLPEGSTEKDIFFEIHTEKTTLKHLLIYLRSHGVTDVTLFDLSCQGDTRESIHHKRYGGRTLKRAIFN